MVNLPGSQNTLTVVPEWKKQKVGLSLEERIALLEEQLKPATPGGSGLLPPAGSTQLITASIGDPRAGEPEDLPEPYIPVDFGDGGGVSLLPPEDFFPILEPYIPAVDAETYFVFRGTIRWNAGFFLWTVEDADCSRDITPSPGFFNIFVIDIPKVFDSYETSALIIGNGFVLDELVVTTTSTTISFAITPTTGASITDESTFTVTVTGFNEP